MKTIVTLIIAALFPFIVKAEVPEWYQNGDVKGQGEVVSIDIKQRIIIIDDQQMRLGSNIKVHSSSQEFAPIGKVKSGQIIGFDYKPNSQGKTEVIEIWIIDEQIISELDKIKGKVSGVSGKSENISNSGTKQNNKASEKEKGKGYRQPFRVSQ